MIFNGFNHFKSSVESTLNLESHCNSPMSVLSSAINLQKEMNISYGRTRGHVLQGPAVFFYIFQTVLFWFLAYWYSRSGKETRWSWWEERKGKVGVVVGGGGGAGCFFITGLQNLYFPTKPPCENWPQDLPVRRIFLLLISLRSPALLLFLTFKLSGPQLCLRNL